MRISFRTSEDLRIIPKTNKQLS